LTDVE